MSQSATQVQIGQTSVANRSGTPLNLVRLDESAYGENHKPHLLEQYKMYVEMTDRISARRNAANTFFLTIHSTFLAAFTLLAKDAKQTLERGVLPLLVGLVLCLVWWLTIRSYSQLNSGKYKIINELEKHLPSAPYDEEWNLLSKGKNKSKYWKLTSVENLVPIVFALLYLALCLFLWRDLSGEVLYA